MQNLDLNNLSKKELKELAEASQARLEAIENEERRKIELKKNYTLKDVPSTYEVNYARLGLKIEEFFKEPSEVILDISSFYELRKRCTNEIKPLREDIYPCPICGKFTLRVGCFGDDYTPKKAVCCDSCDFVMKKKTYGKDYYAWENFHEWLVKHGYLSEDVKFNY